MTDLTSFFRTNLVDDHVANDVNELIAAVIRPEFANTETITATKELSDNDCQFQFITASGANRTVELAPEAISNHPTIIYNAGASNNVLVKDDSGTYTFATLAPDEWMMFLPLNAEGWRAWSQPEREYKLSVTVVSNDLVVALKHPDDTDPSPTRPLCITIAGVKRYVTAATSLTLADATNWFNAGSAELATKEIDYFLYAVWDSNSSVVAIGPSRIPYGRLVSDFSATTTNEKHLGNYANYTSTDDVAVIGRFAATLSAGAGYTWTVPTFTNLNLIHHPIYETRMLSYVPTEVGFSGTPTFTAVRYQVVSNRCRVDIDNYSGTSDATNFTLTAPFANGSAVIQGVGGFMTDNGVVLTGACRIGMTASSSTILVLSNMASGTWTGSGTKGAYFNITFFLN